MRTTFPIILKLSLLVVATVVVTALGINEVYRRGTNKILIQNAIGDLEKEAEFFEYPLNALIDEAKFNVKLLSHYPATSGLMRARLGGGIDPDDKISESEWSERLTNLFKDMLRTHPYYRRIRFIGVANEGKDILRVSRIGTLIERTSEENLSHNNAEPFFQNTSHLPAGDVYLSEPTLDRDQGKVMLPYALVLRAAMPMYTAENEVFGLIIINLDFGMILQDIRKHLLAHRTLYISNMSGDYLIHPDSSFLYASDLARDRRIQRDYPELAQMAADPAQNKITFLPHDTDGGNVFTFRRDYYDPLDGSNYLGIAIEAPYRDIIGKTVQVSRHGLFLSGCLVLISSLAAVFLLRLLLQPLNRIADAVVRYRRGEKDITLPINSPDEIGVLAKEFATLMKQKDEEEWVKESLVKISRSLLGFKDLQGFADTLMAAVTPTIGAQVGVFYLSGNFSHTLKDEGIETLTFLGAYGYQTQETASLPRSFHLGEGLVGQCAKDRKMNCVSDIPTESLRIISALGNAQPKNILLVPVLFENALVGVIEFASVGKFSEVHCSFLEQLSFNIGVIVNTIRASMRTEELLEEARMTAEELQRSEEELRTQQEELQSSNEEMEEKTKTLEEQNTHIRQQAMELADNKQLVEKKAAELQLSNKYKSEFLANMSHELRTPLNSLLLLARSLANNEEGNLSAGQIEEAQVIHSGGLELLSLINDILDLSKVEAGKITIVAADASLTQMIKKLRVQFEPIAKEASLPFHIELAGKLPATIHTDIQRVEQILKNLLSNAFKFTTKGSVTLRVAQASPEVDLQDMSAARSEILSFSVIDTGIGIEESKFKDIFEAFQQENGSIDRLYGGTGLGLTISRQFAHLLGGKIQVISQKGSGSNFTLLLPLALPINVGSGVQGEQSTALRDFSQDTPKELPKALVKAFIADDRETIVVSDAILLIIEDDKSFAATLMKMARERGFKCLVAGDGKTALLLAAERRPAAIILDLGLPDMDGLHVLEQLKQSSDTRHIPVHIISGRENSNEFGLLNQGAIGYLSKPAQKEDIEMVFTKFERILHSKLKRILVVEDDKKSHVHIQNLLEKKNIEITFAESGIIGLDKLSSARFDCIILDLTLQDMTGFEWLERAQETAGHTQLPPIIVYTGKELSESETRVLHQFTNSVIIKGAKSLERLLDEVTLFLHSVESSLSEDQQSIIRMQHDPDRMLQGRGVLLVDDDLRNTFALSRVLKKHGLNIVIADSGQMALEKLKAEKSIELVIMDIMMPVMDGFQAIREIRAQPGYKLLPIIALTARAMPEEQEKCMVAGASDYLTKPVDIARLLTLLRVCMFKQEILP